MVSQTVQKLLTSHRIISDQVERRELEIILSSCETALQQADGDVVELGCYAGTTSLFLTRLLQDTNRTLHVYDSFAGLPEKTKEDRSPAGEQFMPGTLLAAKSQFIKHFRQSRLPLPVIHKGWFSELTGHDMPPRIAFAFLDGDYYGSIQDSLEVVWPKLSHGAIVVVDDYTNEALPGARQAVDEWLKTHPAHLQSIKSLAVIRPV